MLATILKVVGIGFLLFTVFMIYPLLRVASKADEYNGFEEYYWKKGNGENRE